MPLQSLCEALSIIWNSPQILFVKMASFVAVAEKLHLRYPLLQAIGLFYRFLILPRKLSGVPIPFLLLDK